MLFKSSEFKMVFLYIFTSVCIYLGFWLGYYYFPYVVSLVLAPSLCLVVGLIFLGFRYHTAPAVIATLIISFAIGIVISALFVALKIEPSRFFWSCSNNNATLQGYSSDYDIFYSV